MTDPYLEIDALRRRLRAIEEAAGINLAPVTFTTNQIGDRAFYETHRAEIMLAAREGRITESEPVEPPRPVEYGPSGFGGLTQTGQDMYTRTDTAKER